MHWLKFPLCLLLLIGITSAAVFAQKPANNTQTLRRINGYLDRLEKVGFTGTVIVEMDGKKVISKAYGFRDEKLKLKNTNDTVFDIGSITKQFTAAAIVKLETDGKLSTSDKITKYFANVPEDKAGITIHQLLRHSSGLQGGVGKDFEPINEKEFLDKVMNSKLRFEAGTRFSYSNIGYSLLALIIEKVSGQTYEQYLYENLWRPAGMEQTGYSRPVFVKNMVAIGYDDGKDWGRPNEKPWAGKAPFLHLTGNGGVLSTMDDMFRWHHALLGDKILSKTAKQKLYHPEKRPGENENPYYAYGWDVFRTPRNTYRVAHNGTNRVFYADLVRFIDEGSSVLLATNRASRDFFNVAGEISKMMYDPAYAPVVPFADNAANRKFTDEMIKMAIEKGPAEAFAVYKKRAKGTDLLQRRVNDAGYDSIGNGKTKVAIEIFKLNVLVYPKSVSAYDSLGEAYMEDGDKARAIESYKKCLELDPDYEYAKEMLQKLAN